LLAALFPEQTAEDSRAMGEIFARSKRTGEQREFSPGGDRLSIRLLPEDESRIAAAVAVNPNVVAVIMSGSAVTMPWAANVPAIVMSWYPGMEGGHALGSLLTGESDFTGRLPFVVPVDEADLPHWDVDAVTETYDLWHGHALLRRNGTPPAYPFGFGLSYGRTELQSAHLEEVDGDRIHLSCRIANTGGRATSAVVQVYGGIPGSAFERAERRLAGFVRVDVLPDAVTTAEIVVDRRVLDVRVDGAWFREDLPTHLWIGQYAYDPTSLLLTV
jgi:beta-glucosidase